MNGHGMHCNRQLNETKKEHAPVRGLAPVEPKGKFIQISLEMVLFEGYLKRAHQPALNECRDTGYARQNLVGIFTGYLYGCSVMDVFVFGCSVIGRKHIGVNSRTGFNVILNKHLERFGVCVGNNLQRAAPESLWQKQFHSDSHQHLTFGTTPALAVSHTPENGLIYLSLPRQHIVPTVADTRLWHDHTIIAYHSWE